MLVNGDILIFPSLYPRQRRGGEEKKRKIVNQDAMIGKIEIDFMSKMSFHTCIFSLECLLARLLSLSPYLLT